MGSKLELTSEPGVGSTFCFDVSFKVAEGGAEASGNLDHISKVLIVDDNEHNRFILKEILAFKNIVSDEARDGHEALKWIEAGNACDVMLLDYNMPGMDGLETIRQIYEIKRIPLGQLPVILLHSSSDDDIVKAGCNKLKIQHRLVKPIKMQQLYDALSRLNSPEYETKNDGGLTENPAPFIADSRAHTIMIVEDNADIRNYIRSILGTNYTVEEAENGIAGLEMIALHEYDLIISDLMMPEMDGIEMCKRLKASIETDHIPVILLTAKSDIENRIEGLTIGADSYITKPFHPQHLTIRVTKLIELREMLKERFSRKISLGEMRQQETKSESKDELFLQKTIAIILNKMIEYEFNVDGLAQE